MLVIPGSATASVVGESRRFEGCDTGFTPGVLIYLIDATMPTRQGALRVLPTHDVDA
jgi:hypothetical protein